MDQKPKPPVLATKAEWLISYFRSEMLAASLWKPEDDDGLGTIPSPSESMLAALPYIWRRRTCDMHHTPATFNDLPIEFRLLIWEFFLGADPQGTSLAWALQPAKDSPLRILWIPYRYEEVREVKVENLSRVNRESRRVTARVFRRVKLLWYSGTRTKHFWVNYKNDLFHLEKDRDGNWNELLSSASDGLTEAAERAVPILFKQPELLALNGIRNVILSPSKLLVTDQPYFRALSTLYGLKRVLVPLDPLSRVDLPEHGYFDSDVLEVTGVWPFYVRQLHNVLKCDRQSEILRGSGNGPVPDNELGEGSAAANGEDDVQWLRFRNLLRAASGRLEQRGVRHLCKQHIQARGESKEDLESACGECEEICSEIENKERHEIKKNLKAGKIDPEKATEDIKAVREELKECEADCKDDFHKDMITYGFMRLVKGIPTLRIGRP
ncbi:Uu.00g075390.m01.CDS01 [Anthostomella pinea]|uniref:Uu.00g075390.m01.CDS01 n=1 Tax=Anthostomella pinea TaxID=933095 RepID=A0AAI8YP08_9PEZI|nr:Uu.00g075390.m01.CDS01 [Anthostomella pinea]